MDGSADCESDAAEVSEADACVGGEGAGSARLAAVSSQGTERSDEAIEPHELVDDPASSSQQQKQQQEDSSEDEDTVDPLKLPEWIRVNFPRLSSGDELKQLQPAAPAAARSDTNARWWDDSDADSENQLVVAHELKPSTRCEECGSRYVLLRCAECDQRLCFQCADAIHIIPSLARHAVRLCSGGDEEEQHGVEDHEQSQRSRPGRDALGRDPRTASDSVVDRELPPAAPIVSPRTSALPEHHSDQLPVSFAPSKQVESRLCLPVGTHVFFRPEDCGRWSREMLHGTVIHDDGVRANAGSKFYYRLVWLRGVEVLPNGFFRASLELQAPPSDPRAPAIEFGSWWPMEIGIFPTQLSAFRAVVTAEAIARTKFRREQVSGRLVAGDFPSTLVMSEVLEETDAMLGAEFKIRLSKSDDLAFLRDVGRGAWDFRAWMRSIGREEQLKEEDATTRAATSALAPERSRKRANGVGVDAATRALPWQPSTRIRFFLVEQQELLFPARVQRQHLQAIMAQMLHVYIGFAWKWWRTFVKRSRRHELRQRRHHGATRIQQWMRRLTTQWANEAIGSRPQDASLLALQLYQRRQVEAVKLYNFMSQQYREKQRSALRRWAAAARLSDADVRRRLDVHEQTQWHPSYGIAALPKLPKPYAHKRSDGSLAIGDVKLHKQFRANHAGPTDMSYWVVRGRVLAGVYPVGKSFRDARRIVSRADYTTSVLLQEISVFVCLAETAELEAFEHAQEHAGTATLEAASRWTSSSSTLSVSNTSISNTKRGVHLDLQASTRDGHPRLWSFERVVRTKYDALQLELRAAVKMSVRQVQLAQNELREHEALPAESSSELSETLANKLALAQQNVEKARKALETLTMELQFEHFPIPKDGVPEAHELDALLVRVEDSLRARRNVYVFSMNGHGRTGFLAALVLGRLYGIASLQALELAQRLHDCQWSMHSVPSNRSTSSPKAAVQIAAVQRLLAHWDAIYAPITSENSAAGFHESRAQQRGVTAEPFMKKDGFMISAKPDASAASAQLRELRRLQRIATRESSAAELMRCRQRESAARQEMEPEDRTSRHLRRLESRRASLVTMELAMVGAAVAAAIDALVHAVEETEIDAEVTVVAAALAALVDAVVEGARGEKRSS